MVEAVRDHGVDAATLAATKAYGLTPFVDAAVELTDNVDEPANLPRRLPAAELCDFDRTEARFRVS